jgi:hypothetical protein
MLKAAGTERLKLKHEKLLSSFAFNYNLRRYNEEDAGRFFDNYQRFIAQEGVNATGRIMNSTKYDDDAFENKAVGVLSIEKKHSPAVESLPHLRVWQCAFTLKVSHAGSHPIPVECLF